MQSVQSVRVGSTVFGTVHIGRSVLDKEDGDDLESMMSWTAMPGRCSSPRCFLPSTMFMRIDGSAIRASELSREGGEYVRGPQGAEVKVLGAQTHAAENRCLAQVSTSIG